MYAKFVVLPRHRVGEPGNPLSILVGVAQADIAPESLHGDAILCEIEVRVIRRYRSRRPLGDVSDALMTLAETDFNETEQWDCVDKPQNVIDDMIVFDRKYNRDALDIIFDAMRAARDPDPASYDLVWISTRLKSVLPSNDPNWLRWQAFVKKYGVAT